MHEQIPADPATFLTWLQAAAVKRPAAPPSRRTLISNLAERGNTIFEFCDDNRFDIFWNGAPTHLEEVIFNATEFMTGVEFRFRRSSANPDADSGSAIARLPAWFITR